MLIKGLIVISIASLTIASILKTEPTPIEVSNIEANTSNNNEKNKVEATEKQTGLNDYLKELENEDSSKDDDIIRDDASFKILNVLKAKLSEDDEDIQINADDSKETLKTTNYDAGFRDNTKLDNERDNIRVKREDKVIFDNCEGRLVMKLNDGRLECTEDDGTDTVDLDNRIFGGTLCAENQKPVIIGKRVRCLNISTKNRSG